MTNPKGEINFYNLLFGLLKNFWSAHLILRCAGAIPWHLPHYCNKSPRRQTHACRLPKKPLHGAWPKRLRLKDISAPKRQRLPILCGEPLDKLQAGLQAGLRPGGCAIRFALFSAFGLVLVLALTLALMAPDSGDKLMQLDRKSLEIRLGVLGVCPHQGALSGKALVDH